MGVHIVGSKLEDGTVFSDCFVQISLHLQSKSEVVVGTHMVGVELNSPTKLCDSAIQVPCDAESDRQIFVSVGVVRIKAESLAILHHGTAPVFLSCKHIPEVIVGVHVVRVEMDGGTVGSDGTVQIPALTERNSLIEVGHRIVWVSPMRRYGAAHRCHADYQEYSPDPGSHSILVSNIGPWFHFQTSNEGTPSCPSASLLW